MLTKVKGLGLTSNQLKIFALLVMTIDHIGYILLPQMRILRYIGRLAMPIFAWMIAEGCEYTKNRTRYLLTMLGFGVVCQVVNYVFEQSLNQCILITFSMSLILIYTMDYAEKKKNFLSLCLMGSAVLGVCYICVFLPGDLPGTDFSVDYGVFGVMLPVVIYIAKTKEQKLMAAAGVLAMLAIWNGFIQWFALLSLPLLALYNGQRGKMKLKYLFYLYYPLHLAALYGIDLLLK